MNLDLALKVIAAARRRAESLGRPVAIAVVDTAGWPVAFARMDGALLVSVRLAHDKAYTAALLQMSTARLGEMAAPGGPLYGIQTTDGGRMVIFGGGEFFAHGAVGVSGGTVEEDTDIARSAAASARDP